MITPNESKPHSVNGRIVHNRITVSMSNDMPNSRAKIVRAIRVAHIFATLTLLESDALAQLEGQQSIQGGGHRRFQLSRRCATRPNPLPKSSNPKQKNLPCLEAVAFRILQGTRTCSASPGTFPTAEGEEVNSLFVSCDSGSSYGVLMVK
jgi:hypothetical protein